MFECLLRDRLRGRVGKPAVVVPLSFVIGRTRKVQCEGQQAELFERSPGVAGRGR